MHTIKTLLVFCICSIIVLACTDTSNTTPNENSNKTISGFLPVADSKIYYEITGKGEPIVLLYGAFLDRRMWEQQVNVFSKQYQVITIDMRAHGLTTDGDSSYYMYDAVRILLDSLHINSAVIGGLSKGAMIATDFAIAYPEYTYKLILVTPGLNGSPPDEVADSSVINAFRLLSENKNINTIKMPVLIVSTDLDNPIIGRNVDTLLKAMPQAKHILIKSTAHMPNMEKPEEFNKAVKEFLEQKTN